MQNIFSRLVILMQNIFSRFAHPKTPGLPKSKVDQLAGFVNSLNKESRCSSAMSSILRTLDYEPDNHDVRELAHLMVWGCIGVHHTCREPLSEVQINDRRLDSFFNECAICSHQWIPGPPAFESWISPEKTVMISSTGVGGYCQNCKKAFCREHVADPLPTLTMGGNPHCPLCGCELDCYHAYGRKARQALRLNKRLSYVVLVRDGFIPPESKVDPFVKTENRTS